MNKATIFQYVILFIALIITFNIISLIITNRKEKRISDFSLSKKDFDDKTIIDKISNSFWNFIHRLSNHLIKNNYLLKKAASYEKYIFVKEEKYKSPIDYIVVKIITFIIFVLLYILFTFVELIPFNIYTIILFLTIAILLPDLVWKISYIKKCQKISLKLYESIIIIDDNLSKTNIYNAINKVIELMDENIADEYQRILTDLSYNISLYQAFKRFYERTKIPEIKNIYHLLNIEGEDLELTFKRIRNEFEYVDKLNSSVVGTNNVVTALKVLYMVIPVCIVLIILIINPTYFNELLSSYLGIVLLQIVFLMYILEALIINIIMEDKK